MEKLNDDILLTIFEYLDNKSLLNAVRVSKRWNRLITSTTSLIRKPTLTMDISIWKDDLQAGEDLCKNLTQKLSAFPFRNFKLTSNSHLNANQGKVMRLFKQNAKNTEKLCLNSFSGGLMLSMLKYSASTLTHLIVSSTFPDEEYSGFVDLPNLEYLKLNTIDSILRVIKCENLKELDIDNCRDEHAAHVFIENCKNLPKLRKLKTFRLFWQFQGINDLPFELEELEVTNFSLIDLYVIHDFLLSQKKSLKSLKITESLIRATTINFVLESLPKLKTLIICGSIYSSWDHEIQIQQANIHLKTLEMYLITPQIRLCGAPELNEADDIEKIIKKCKNLENLQFRGSVSTSNTYEGKISLPNLKSLKIKDLRQFGFWHCFELDNLETFTMEVLNCCPENVDLLLDILPKMPNLKNLQINQWIYISIMKTSHMKEFVNLLKNYETFRIKRCEVLPVRLINFLKISKMNTFKLFEICYEHDEGNADIIKDRMKYLKFQMILKQFQLKRIGSKWEKDVEYFEENEEDEIDNERVRQSFQRFMYSSLHPQY